MKKNYITTLLILFSICAAQAQWAGFNNNSGDNLWHTDANWAFPGGVTELEPNQAISIYVNPTVATLDDPYTAKTFKIPSNKTNDFVLNGETSLDTLFIDIADATQANSDTGLRAISNESTSVTALTINSHVKLANSVTPDQYKGISVVYTENSGSSIEFTSTTSLTIGGTASTGFHGTGTVNINGNIKGNQGILLGEDAKVFFGSATSDVSEYSGTVTLANNSELTFTSDGASSISSTKLQCNGTNGVVTLNSENVFVPNEIRVSKSNQANRGVNFNVNANQTLRAVKLEGDNSFFNLTIDPSVTSISFYANNSSWSGTCAFNISGFQDGVLRFGIDSNSLNNGAYLSNIHIIDGVHTGKSVTLDDDGYLYLTESLSVKSNEIEDLNVYPNPVTNVLKIQTTLMLQTVQLANLMGQIVYRSSDNLETVNMHALNSGVYVLTVTDKKGATSTQRIVKN